MKRYWLLIFILHLSLIGYSQRNDPQKLNWLEGKWNRVDVQGDAQAFEKWESNSETLTGIGVMLSEGDTVFVERLSISKGKRGLVYTTRVTQTAEPTTFRITRAGSNGFMCENEGQDFPKKIAYQLNGGLLTVTVSGNSRSRKFIFRKED